MIYREYLVMRKALAWFVAVLLAIMLIGLINGVIQVAPTQTDYAAIGVTSGWIAAIFASIFGVALGNGSREAARVLWVLPTARWKLALRVIVVDLAGTTVAFVCVYAAMLLLLKISDPHFRMETLGAVNAAGIVMALAMVYATYGWSALAGMLGRRVPYCGIFALPALWIWMIFAQSQSTLGSILRAPIVANPFTIFNAGLALNSWEHHRFTLDPVTSSLQRLGTVWETPVLIATAVATCGLAVLFWQRAQAIY